MERTYIKRALEEAGKKVKICGFVHTLRDQGSIKFLLLRDATGIIQCVVKNGSSSFEEVGDLSLESVVEVHGTVRKEKQAPGGAEVEIESVVVLSGSQPELPIPVIVEKGGEETDVSKRFDWRWIDLRKEGRLNIFKVWSSLEEGIREYFKKEGYVQIYTPSLMSAPSESGSDVFEVKYFEKKAYLAQSPQFYKQMAMASGFEKVFMVGPVFRAESSFTTRHMTEFTGWDFELSYIRSHYDVMAEQEKILVSAFKKAKLEVPAGLDVPKIPFPKITMEEAKEKLKKAGVASEKWFDVSPEEEKELCRIIKEETGHDFVFLIDWPIEARPFYHMRHEENPKLTKSFDLLFKGVEIVTGAQREHRVEFLEKQAEEKGLSLDEIKDYLNFFRYGCPPHGGCGMGPGRIIMKILNLPSVKEATFLPRDVKRLTP